MAWPVRRFRESTDVYDQRFRLQRVVSTSREQPEHGLHTGNGCSHVTEIDESGAEELGFALAEDDERLQILCVFGGVSFYNLTHELQVRLIGQAQHA